MLVICNGMGRGGSTLQYNLVRALLTVTESGEGHGYMVDRQGHTQFMPSAQLWAWANAREFHLVKMHAAHAQLEEFLLAGETRVCYIYRDIRDVALSRRTAFGERGAKLVRGLQRSHNTYYVLRDVRDRFASCFVWQRYEEVTVDLARAARELADLIGLSVSDSELDTVVDACSLDTTKGMCDELRSGLENEVQRIREKSPRLAAQYLQKIGRGQGPGDIVLLDQKSLLLYNHIGARGGASGVWKDSLDSGTLEMVMTNHGEWLEENGYLSEPPASGGS
jgi:hypothetical protein